jgi:polar amino acid transport system substrate-binding protein
VAIQNSELKPYLRVLGTTLALWASLLAADPSHAQSNGDQTRPFKGELRAALIVSDNGLVTRNPQGELSGILVEIANAMATSFGVPLHLVPYNNIVRYNLSIGKDEWDVALAPRDLSRIERLAFSETFLEVDNSYVARPGSSLNSVDDVDRTGIRVAVAEHSPADGFLTRTLRKATIVRLPRGIDEAREALTFGRADVYADNAQLAYRIADELPGATVLVGRFSSVQMSFAVPKSNAAALSSLNDFIRKAKHDGIIADLIKRAGLRGVRSGR